MNPNPKIILATPDILVIFEIQDTPLVEIIVTAQNNTIDITAVSYTHLTLPTIVEWCRSRWSPYH